MRNSKTSVDLSIWACYGLGLVTTILVAIYLFGDVGTIEQNLVFHLGFLAIATFVYLVIYRLIRLMLNIKKDKVFVPENVAYLRRVSWDCFGVATVCVVGGLLYKDLPFALFMLMAFIAATIGLILWVIKNVLESATEQKPETDPAAENEA